MNVKAKAERLRREQSDKKTNAARFLENQNETNYKQSDTRPIRAKRYRSRAINTEVEK